MQDADIFAAFNGGETDRVEFKESDRSTLREPVCALANDLGNTRSPGYLFVGIRDDGTCADLIVDDALLLKLSQIHTGGDLQPLPSIDVRRVDLGNCTCAVIIVSLTDDPPLKYNGRVYVRVGTSTLVAAQQDERILIQRRSSRDIPLDHRLVPGSRVEDLNLVYFKNEYLPVAYAPDVLEANHRTTHEQLVALRFASDSRLTIGGLIVLSDDPLPFLPGAYVQFVAYRGQFVTDPVANQKVLAGRIDVVARATLDYSSTVSGSIAPRTAVAPS